MRVAALFTYKLDVSSRKLSLIMWWPVRTGEDSRVSCAVLFMFKTKQCRGTAERE